MKLFKSTISSLLLTSLLTTGIVSGQTSNPKQTVQPQRQTLTQTSSKYVVDLGELFKSGQIVFSEGFEQEVEMLENALSARDNKGTIILDRNATKRVPVINNLVAHLMAEDVAPSLRGVKILRIDLPAVLSDSKNNAEVSARLDSALKQIEATNGKAILFAPKKKVKNCKSSIHFGQF